MPYRTQFNHLALRAGLVFSVAGLIVAQSIPVGAQTPPINRREMPPSAPREMPPSAPREMPPPPPEAGIAQPNQSNNDFSGEVKHYLLTPQGFVEGLILSNGLQVKFPPHMGESVVKSIKIGDRINVMGNPGTRNQLGQEVAAYFITNSRTGRRVVDEPPVSPPIPPANMGYSNLSVAGAAATWVVGQKGEINGIILTDGSQVRFSPDRIGSQLSNLAKPGVRVQAQGFGTKNSYGQALEATSLIVDGRNIAISSIEDDIPPVPSPEGRPGKPPVPSPDALPERPPIIPPEIMPGQPPAPPTDGMPEAPPVMPPEIMPGQPPVPPPASDFAPKFRR
ncbi:MAG: hypothetical protein AB1589_02885 [Cyanobacteriota bacterium]